MSSLMSTGERQRVNFRAQQDLLDFTKILFSGSFQVFFWCLVSLSQDHKQNMQLFILGTDLNPSSPHNSAFP